MEIKRKIQAFVDECLAMRRIIQEGRPLSDLEYRRLKSHLEMLLAELDFGRPAPPPEPRRRS